MVTTPDRPKGRGLHPQPNPVRKRCEEAGVLTLTPSSLRSPELEKEIARLQPDIFVVASFGKLIPDSWLRIPRKAAFNIHPSLLPKYRGAAPITWQILAGEKETGVSIAEVTKDLDAGDVFHQIRVPLGTKETTASLTVKLAQLSAKVLGEVLSKLERGELQRHPQNHAESSYARKLTKEDGYLILTSPAFQLERQIRAFHPWPGAFINFQGRPLRIVEASLDSIACAEAEPGTLLEINSVGYLRIQTGKGSLKVSKVQLPGKRVVSGKDFANGERLKPLFVFESLKFQK